MALPPPRAASTTQSDPPAPTQAAPPPTSSAPTSEPIRTAAHRAGGKFASMSATAAPSPPTQTKSAALASGRGGKFAKLAAAAAAAPPKSSIIEPSQMTPKKPRIERQAQVFADLDEAENLVLDLLTLASSTAQNLSDLTIASETRRRAKLEEETNVNGVEYLQKVKRIHELLSPHANLVVAYKNHGADGSSGGGGGAAGSGVQGKFAKGSTEGEDGTKQLSQSGSNMYAARVEMRLALERRAVLEEMLRLERERTGDDDLKNGVGNFVGGGAITEEGGALSLSSKRKWGDE